MISFPSPTLLSYQTEDDEKTLEATNQRNLSRTFQIRPLFEEFPTRNQTCH